MSPDGKKWLGPVAVGSWPDTADRKTVIFYNPVPARAVRLIALTEAGNRGAWTSAAEITVLSAPAPDPAPAPYKHTGKMHAAVPFFAFGGQLCSELCSQLDDRHATCDDVNAVPCRSVVKRLAAVCSNLRAAQNVTRT
jgi:hypothetical protein